MKSLSGCQSLAYEMKKRISMRIAQFISNFPKNEKSIMYGKSMAATNLCLSLSQKGHSVQVFTPSDNRKDCIDNYKGIIVHRYASVFGYRSERISPGIMYKPLNYDADIVHIHSGISASLIAGFRYAMKKKIPLIITWHGDSIREYGRYSGIIPGVAAYFYKRYLANKILSYVDIIISPSEFYINSSEFLGKYKDKIVIIPNGINLDEYDIPYSKEDCKKKMGLNAKNVILFVGGLYYLKGPHILLNAILKVIKKHKDTIFVFVGSGNIEEYRRLSEKLCIENYVKFTGYVDKEKPLYYKSADVFVLPSYEEMFPMVLLEASACGLPIIASELETLKCIIEDEHNGFFTKRGDENDFAEKIIYLLDHEEIGNVIGMNALAKVKNYSWDRISLETEKNYKLAIDRKCI